MTRTASTKVQWRVQVRRSRAHKWVNKGLFETRKVARDMARLYRALSTFKKDGSWESAYGFGNTRTIRYERPRGKK